MIKVEKQTESNTKKIFLVPDNNNLCMLGEFCSYPDEGFYLTLGHIGEHFFTFDEHDWGGFVKFVNEIDGLLKERTNG